MVKQRGPNCRIFIGNLATEKTSHAELREIFSKYGRITEDIVLRKSFGFVQFATPEAARDAIKGENGRLIGGLRIDISMADNRPPKAQVASRTLPRKTVRTGKPIARRDRRGSRDDERPEPEIPGAVCQVAYLTPALRSYAKYVQGYMEKALKLPIEVINIERIRLDTVWARADSRGIKYVLVVSSAHSRRDTVDCTVLVNGATEGFQDVALSEAANIMLQLEAGGQAADGQELVTQLIQQALSLQALNALASLSAPTTPSPVVPNLNANTVQALSAVAPLLNPITTDPLNTNTSLLPLLSLVSGVSNNNNSSNTNLNNDFNRNNFNNNSNNFNNRNNFNNSGQSNVNATNLSGPMNSNNNPNSYNGGNTNNFNHNTNNNSNNGNNFNPNNSNSNNFNNSSHNFNGHNQNNFSSNNYNGNNFNPNNFRNGNNNNNNNYNGGNNFNVNNSNNNGGGNSNNFGNGSSNNPDEQLYTRADMTKLSKALYLSNPLVSSGGSSRSLSSRPRRSESPRHYYKERQRERGRSRESRSRERERSRERRSSDRGGSREILDVSSWPVQFEHRGRVPPKSLPSIEHMPSRSSLDSASDRPRSPDRLVIRRSTGSDLYREIPPWVSQSW
eukprot:CAMPEP_0174275144 /NCGR_PEP_ID=MMETSP0439-20130205/59668_1 /TAXON_ID=0 /ORGANISM="Stereomyxa ramosa, Strain Chinc5" /LENGTH=617 /DNA_ID=CAMNT_0015367225 /DNA_START=561 /DNA_END=2411 /DNA_ORIENTATION=-